MGKLDTSHWPKESHLNKPLKEISPLYIPDGTNPLPLGVSQDQFDSFSEKQIEYLHGKYSKIIIIPEPNKWLNQVFGGETKWTPKNSDNG